MIRLYLIRHGATAGNLQKRYIGRTDEPLCDAGRAQINALKTKQLQADKLFVSPMIRTRQTAEILFPETAYTVVEDFRETDFGDFEGQTAAELSSHPDYRVWVDSFCQGPVPNGECVSNFKRRCCAAFLEAMRSVEDNSTAAFVIHGGVIMAVMEAFAQPQRSFYDHHIANGAYISAKYCDGIIFDPEYFPAGK